MGIVQQKEFSSTQPQQLIGVQTKVCPDGSEADIALHTTDGRVDFTVTFESMAAAHAEIRSASLLMLYRQSIRRDGGASAISDMFATALRPAQTEVVIDAMTGDRIFLMHFAERMPIVIRQTPEQVVETLTNLALEAKRSAN